MQNHAGLAAVDDTIRAKLVVANVFRLGWTRRYPDTSVQAADLMMTFSSDIRPLSTLQAACHWVLTEERRELIFCQVWNHDDGATTFPVMVLERNVQSGETKLSLNFDRMEEAIAVSEMLPAGG